jgi:hypothetical protein
MFELEMHSILTQLIAQEYIIAFTVKKHGKRELSPTSSALQPPFPYNTHSMHSGCIDVTMHKVSVCLELFQYF